MRTMAATILILILALSTALTPFAARNHQNDSATSESSLILTARRPAPKPSTVSIAPDADIERVIVKLVEGSRGRLSRGELSSLGGKDLKGINRIIRDYSHGAINRLTDKSPEKVR